ncbi:MAG: glutathione-regulated potassium-efflux system protein KefC [Candidatus Polarisedimenticolaceae bacterium]|nr:glutathione-regulated potassium-efflux system protein KefC [Candidatus Polarisedimenticolaceae bacterium]
MNDHSLLVNTLIYLSAAVVAVPLAKRLGLGSVLGYLIAGVAIGPWGLSLINNVSDILHFAEFGVVLLLFLIGLELHPRRLWEMRRPIFGMGGVQVVATTLLLFLVIILLGLPWHTALVIAMGLSLSSTAIALQTLKEKSLLSTKAGNSAFSILLFQDMAVIPMLALIPILGETLDHTGDPMVGVMKAVAVIFGIIIGGHYLIRPIFRYIAGTGLREIFTAFSLLLVIGIALLMQAVDMSMALGTFLAGVLLAESEYRHELEVEIEPFKGLLLGLFFISVGMSIDFGQLLAQPLLILSLVVGLVLIKLLVLVGITFNGVIPEGQRGIFVFLLCQGGEFAFVLFSVALASGALSSELVGLLFVVVALSMMSTPLLLLINEKVFHPRFIRLGHQPPVDESFEESDNPVIIAGFGQFGRSIGRLLHANGIDTTVLDHNPDQIESARRFGYRIYFGDASRLDILRATGAEQAKLLIVAVDNPEMALEIVDLAQAHFPNLQILSRVKNIAHATELVKREITLFRYETTDSALRLGEDALKSLGFGAYQAKMMANNFRDHEHALLQEIYRTEKLEKRVDLSMKAREELERIFLADKKEQEQREKCAWRER